MNSLRLHVIDPETRVLVDTSTWVSALINEHGRPAVVAEAALQRKFRFVISDPLISEVDRVANLGRVRRRIRFEPELVDLIIVIIIMRGIRVEPKGVLQLSRDTHDDIILETAIDGGAKYVVSRDEDMTRDLSTIAYLRARGVEVLTVAQFLRLLDSPAE